MGRREPFLAGGLLLLGVNSLYLAALASASLFYFANVGLHVVLGLAVSVALGAVVRRRWPTLGSTWRAAAGTFGAGAVLGVALLFTGATRPFRPILYTHVALVGLGALLALVAGLRGARPSKSAVRASAIAAALLAVVAPAARVAADLFPPRHEIAHPRPWTERGRARAAPSSRPRPRPTSGGRSRRTSS
jgi:hypothetical protein